MFQSRIAEWSYYLGFVSAAAALVYRAFWFGSLGVRLFGVSRSTSSQPDRTQHSSVCDLDSEQFAYDGSSLERQNYCHRQGGVS